MEEIQEATFTKDLEAKRLGLSEEELEKQTKKEKLNSPNKKFPENDDSEKENKLSDMDSFINQWEVKNFNESHYKYEKLPLGIEVEDRTQHHLSFLFLSYVLREAHEEMRRNYYYKKYANVLGSLLDVYKVIVKNTKDKNELQFEVYINKRIFFKKQSQLVIFSMNSEGQIILP